MVTKESTLLVSVCTVNIFIDPESSFATLKTIVKFSFINADISDEESDSEIMTTKAKYVPPEGTSTEYELPDAIVMEPKTKKNENPITKAALAKKLLKKKIIVNSKTCFDENGEVSKP